MRNYYTTPYVQSSRQSSTLTEYLSEEDDTVEGDVLPAAGPHDAVVTALELEEKHPKLCQGRFYRLSVRLSVCQSVCPSDHLSVCPSVPLNTLLLITVVLVQFGEI